MSGSCEIVIGRATRTLNARKALFIAAGKKVVVKASTAMPSTLMHSGRPRDRLGPIRSDGARHGDQDLPLAWSDSESETGRIRSQSHDGHSSTAHAAQCAPPLCRGRALLRPFRLWHEHEIWRPCPYRLCHPHVLVMQACGMREWEQQRGRAGHRQIRVNHPSGSLLSAIDSLIIDNNSLISGRKFPVNLRDRFSSQFENRPLYRTFQAARPRERVPPRREIPCKFPC